MSIVALLKEIMINRIETANISSKVIAGYRPTAGPYNNGDIYMYLSPFPSNLPTTKTDIVYISEE